MAINFPEGTQNLPAKTLNHGYTTIQWQTLSGQGPHILSGSGLTMTVKESTSHIYLSCVLPFGITTNNASAAYLEFSTNGGSSYSTWDTYSSSLRYWSNTGSEGTGSDGGGFMSIHAAHNHGQAVGTSIIYRIRMGNEATASNQYVCTNSSGFPNVAGWGRPGIYTVHFTAIEVGS